jgi:DNA-binding response OmpR family regulator
MAAYTAHLGEEIIELTPTECRVLYALMKSAGHALGSYDIAQKVWREKPAKTDLVRTVIRRLREKLKDKPPRILINERGSGYRFVTPR